MELGVMCHLFQSYIEDVVLRGVEGQTSIEYLQTLHVHLHLHSRHLR